MKLGGRGQMKCVMIQTRPHYFTPICAISDCFSILRLSLLRKLGDLQSDTFAVTNIDQRHLNSRCLRRLRFSSSCPATAPLPAWLAARPAGHVLCSRCLRRSCGSQRWWHQPPGLASRQELVTGARHNASAKEPLREGKDQFLLTEEIAAPRGVSTRGGGKPPLVWHHLSTAGPLVL